MKNQVLMSKETVSVNKDTKVAVNKIVHPGMEIKIGDPTMFTLARDNIRLC